MESRSSASVSGPVAEQAPHEKPVLPAVSPCQGAALLPYVASAAFKCFQMCPHSNEVKMSVPWGMIRWWLLCGLETPKDASAWGQRTAGLQWIHVKGHMIHLGGVEKISPRWRVFSSIHPKSYRSERMRERQGEELMRVPFILV